MLWVAAVMVGAVSKLQAVWSFADVANALMAVPNLISLLLLSGVVAAETRRYLWEGNVEQDAGESMTGFPVAVASAEPTEAARAGES